MKLKYKFMGFIEKIKSRADSGLDDLRFEVFKLTVTI
jgi:hypothetical protein